MTPLPELATEVKASGEAIETLKQCAAEMIGAVDGKPMEVLRESLVCPLIWSPFDTHTHPRAVLPRCISKWPTPRMPCSGQETRERHQDAW
jgi:hypothetical protein